MISRLGFVDVTAKVNLKDRAEGKPATGCLDYSRNSQLLAHAKGNVEEHIKMFKEVADWCVVKVQETAW